MIYNVQAKTYVLISVIILVLMSFIGKPIGNWALYRMEMRKSAASYDALVTEFEHAKNDNIPCVDLSATMEFEWEAMYIFGPYTTEETINNMLGHKWQFTSQTSIAENDSITLILFAKAKKVVASMEVPRGVADFAPLSGEIYSSDNACFSVDEKGKVLSGENP